MKKRKGEVKGFEQARGVLGPFKPWNCRECGGLISNGTEQIGHLWSTACVEVLKKQMADLQAQLAAARERIAELEGSSTPNLLSYEEYRKLVEGVAENQCD